MNEGRSPDVFKASGLRRVRWAGLRYKPLRQPVDRLALAVADDVTVDSEGNTEVAMPELILNYGNWGSALDQLRCDNPRRSSNSHHNQRKISSGSIVLSASEA